MAVLLVLIFLSGIVLSAVCMVPPVGAIYAPTAAFNKKKKIHASRMRGVRRTNTDYILKSGSEIGRMQRGGWN